MLSNKSRQKRDFERCKLVKHCAVKLRKDISVFSALTLMSSGVLLNCWSCLSLVLKYL